MKTVATVVLIIIALVIVVPWGWDYIKAKTDVVNDAFKNQIDGPIIVDQVRKEVQRDMEMLKDKAVNIELLNNKALDKETTLANKQSELSRQEKLLGCSLDWLDNHTTTDVLSVGSKKYDYQTVTQDAEARTNDCQSRRMVIEALAENMAMLKEAVREGKASIQQKYMDLQRRIANLDIQEVILNIDQEKRDVERLIADLGIGTQASSKSRYEEALERRVEKAKVNAKFDAGSASQGGVVEYPNEPQTTGLDAARAYRDAYLKNPATTSPASPVAEPTSSQASMSDTFLNILPNEN